MTEQSPDGKVVSAGSGCELSELMKRRLESVASTGSSASSGFIEDKSYCDSEEEEEGKGQARLASFQPPHSCPSLFWLGTNTPCRLFSSLMGRFLPLLSSTIAAAGATVTHRVWGGGCLFPVLTRAGLCSLAYA